jgi:outer membrane receptor protein involved in Fe transport
MSRFSLSVALFASLAVPAHGQEDAPALGDLSIEQLMDLSVEKVYGASKYEQSVAQAPASVTIVSAEDIRMYGHRTLSDVLRSMRGVYVSDDHNYEYVGVRGFLRPGDYNTRVLILVDGHRMNDNVYDSAYVGREAMVNIDLIDRVEFIRGPSSSIYGSSAFFGVVNVITKKGRDLDGAEISAQLGSQEMHQGRVSYGKRFGENFEVVASGAIYRSGGARNLYYPEFDQRISDNPRAANDGIVDGADGEEAMRLFGSVRYRDLTLSAFASTRTREVPTASFGSVFNSGLEQTTDERAYVDVAYARTFGSIDLRGHLFYDRYAYDGDYPTDYAQPGEPPLVVLSKDETLGEWLGAEWMLSRRLFERHTLLAGIEYRENLNARQRNYDETIAPAYYLDVNARSRVLSAFVQGDVALHDRLRLNAGVRLDHYPDSFGATFNPRVALIYNPWDKTVLKALYGRAFRAPNAYESDYYSEQAEYVRLTPERIGTYELVYEQNFDRRHRMTLSGYRYQVRDLITQVENNGHIHFDNLDQVRASGVELEGEGRYSNGLRVRASYALQRTHDASTDAELTSSPRHLAKLNLAVPLWGERLTAGLEMQYSSAMRTLAGAQAAGFTTANLSLTSRGIAPGLDLSLNFYNLLDRAYGFPGAEDHAQDVIQQDGRTFRLKATYRF